MAKKKYNYRFVFSKNYFGKKLYDLVVFKGKNKRCIIVNDVCCFYTVGNYLVYKRYHGNLWYMRTQNRKTEICLGRGQDRVAYFSQKENGKVIIKFFNQHGTFLEKSYSALGRSDIDCKNLLIGYRDDDKYDVYMIFSSSYCSLESCHLEEFVPSESIIITDYSIYLKIKYNIKIKCWSEAKSWFEKIKDKLLKVISYC